MKTCKLLEIAVSSKANREQLRHFACKMLRAYVLSFVMRFVCNLQTNFCISCLSKFNPKPVKSPAANASLLFTGFSYRRIFVEKNKQTKARRFNTGVVTGPERASDKCAVHNSRPRLMRSVSTRAGRPETVGRRLNSNEAASSSPKTPVLIHSECREKKPPVPGSFSAPISCKCTHVPIHLLEFIHRAAKCRELMESN